MSKQTLTDILWDQIKEGDVILKAGGSGGQDKFRFTVEREILYPEPGFGTAIVGHGGQRYRGFMTKSGGFYYLDEDGLQRESRSYYNPWSDFLPEEDKKKRALPEAKRIAEAITEGGLEREYYGYTLVDGLRPDRAADRVLRLLRKEGF